eukprot:6192236-Pleurochrysis_carterae.AAC.2
MSSPSAHVNHFAYFPAHASAGRHATTGMVQSVYLAAMVGLPSAFCNPACSIGARDRAQARYITACYAMDADALQNTLTPSYHLMCRRIMSKRAACRRTC